MVPLRFPSMLVLRREQRNGIFKKLYSSAKQYVLKTSTAPSPIDDPKSRQTLKSFTTWRNFKQKVINNHIPYH